MASFGPYPPCSRSKRLRPRGSRGVLCLRKWLWVSGHIDLETRKTVAPGHTLPQRLSGATGTRRPPARTYPRGAQVLRLGGQVLRHLAAARGQVEDGRGGHVGRLHIVRVVEAALAAGAAGAAAAAAAQVAAAAGRVAAGGAAAGAGVLAEALRWGDRARA